MSSNMPGAMNPPPSRQFPAAVANIRKVAKAARLAVGYGGMPAPVHGWSMRTSISPRTGYECRVVLTMAPVWEWHDGPVRVCSVARDAFMQLWLVRTAASKNVGYADTAQKARALAALRFNLREV